MDRAQQLAALRSMPDSIAPDGGLLRFISINEITSGPSHSRNDAAGPSLPSCGVTQAQPVHHTLDNNTNGFSFAHGESI